jgi:hypothetical protein
MKNNVGNMSLFKEFLEKLFSIGHMCYNFFSSIGLDARIGCGYSSTTGCCNSSSSIGLDVGTHCSCSSTTSCCNSFSSIDLDVEINYNCSSTTC